MAERSPYSLEFEQIDGSMVHVVGGKCASLGELRRAGFDVPRGFAITTEAHRRFLEANRIGDQLAELISDLQFDDVNKVAAASGRARAVVESAALPDDVEEAIRVAFSSFVEHIGLGPIPVAVRSSATSEDHYTASFAGQLETYLWTVGIESVLANVLRCWGGLYTPHALIYRERMGFAQEESIMSVGVQHMVDARSAGVMFTMNPVNGDRSKIMIESCWGLGEGIVKGDINPDRFLVDKVTFEILERVVAEKPLAYRFDPTSDSVEALPVEKQSREVASISDEEVAELAATGKRIERHYGRPQDVEWAAGQSGAISILQSRAETVWSAKGSGPIAADGKSAVDRVIASFLPSEPGH